MSEVSLNNFFWKKYPKAGGGFHIFTTQSTFGGDGLVGFIREKADALIAALKQEGISARILIAGNSGGVPYHFAVMLTEPQKDGPTLAEKLTDEIELEPEKSHVVRGQLDQELGIWPRK